jgi:hypothetical protein
LRLIVGWVLADGGAEGWAPAPVAMTPAVTAIRKI